MKGRKEEVRKRSGERGKLVERKWRGETRGNKSYLFSVRDQEIASNSVTWHILKIIKRYC
jgi:hypothetical protein